MKKSSKTTWVFYNSDGTVFADLRDPKGKAKWAKKMDKDTVEDDAPLKGWIKTKSGHLVPF